MNRPPRSALSSALLGFSLALSFGLNASDWPHWLGPDGSNRIVDQRFQPDLSKYTTAWTATIGRGYSSVILAGGKALAMGHDEKTGETVFCFDAATGKELWKHAYPAELLPRMHPGGPNASATVVGDRVLTISKDGQMFCLNAATGQKIWETKLPEAIGVAIPQWGFGGSPVVSGNHIIVSAGKVATLALDSGKTIWVSPENQPPAYASPVPFELDGTPYIASMNGKGLSIVSRKDGSTIAQHPLKAQFDLLAPTPIVVDQGRRIFISANASSELLAFDGKSLQSVWTTKDLKNALNNSVVVEGVIYGIDGRQGTPTCRLVAMNLADGKVLWTKESFGYGNTIGIGKTLLALTESGELVTAKISPAGYEELGRRQVLGKLCWTTPTYADGRIYVRNDQGALVCLAPGLTGLDRTR